MTSSNNSQSSSHFRLKWWIILPVLVAAAIWGGSWVWDYYKLYSGQTPMFDVAIKLQVGDEIVEIDRTVPCIKVGQGEAFQYLFSTAPFIYRARDLSTGAHLKDGRVVMSIIPKVCLQIEKAMKAGAPDNIVPADFLPMTAIVDNFEDPQLMKVFGARSYYAREDAEVKVLSYEIKPSERGTFPSFEDEFSWFVGGTLGGGSDDLLFFDSAKIVCRPLDVFPGWWGGPADAFDNITEPVFAYDVPGFDVPGTFKVPFSTVSQPFTGSIARNLPLVSEPYARYVSLDHVIPALKVNGVYEFDSENRGVLMLNRTDGKRAINDITESDGTKVTIEKSKINIGTKVVTVVSEWRHKPPGPYIPVKGPFFFDSEARSICSFNANHIRFLDTR